MIVIPYKNLKLDIYPGSIINRCKADYRKKIDSKEQNKEIGSVYIQKCVGIPNFQGFAFMRVGSDGCKEIDSESLKKGLENLLGQAVALKIPVRHILIPYSQALSKPDFLIDTLIDLLDSAKYSKVK